MSEKISPGAVKDKLQALIVEAKLVAPSLASRLDEIKRWIKSKTPGQLMGNRHVLYFLIELCEDSQVWLDLNSGEPEASQSLLDHMEPAEQYWYTDLFPKWFKEYDPKLWRWKESLMAGEFSQKDKELIDDLCNRINNQQGSAWDSYILDLSMATDLIVSGALAQPLCVQLTTLSSQLSIEKKKYWETTLKDWRIQRGLFVNFNPTKDRSTLESSLRQESDRLPESGYNEIEL
jgi:hypothetical protein